MPKFTTLYSGSSGNAGVVEYEGRFLLVDMGQCCRTTLRGIEALGLSVTNLMGILVTHEHSDHIKGLKVFLKKHPVPVYSSAATLDEMLRLDAVPPGTELVEVDGQVLDIGGFIVESFYTSHDAAGCCGYRITLPDGKVMAIATDLGHVPENVYGRLQGTELVALESNYDREKLRRGPYPYYLKKRISSSRGHLSNEDSAQVVARLIGNGCRRIVLCHLSLENNHPDLALGALDSALFSEGILMPQDCVVQVSRRHEVSPWVEF